MRHILKTIALISSATICLTSCKKKEPVEIVTLSKLGKEFYYGEKVPVWVGVDTELGKATFDWKCSGGSFDSWETQNLFENLWIAPDKKGTYTVTATARNGNSSSSRSTELQVTRYFFDEFQNNYTFNGAGWSQSNTTQVFVNQDKTPELAKIELTSNGTSGPNFRRTLNSDLKFPFSVRTQLGWKNFFRSGQNMYISMYFRQPDANKNYPFIREIRWEFWPTANPATTDNYQIRFETFIPSANKSTWSANSNTINNFPSPLPLYNPVKGKKAELQFANGQEKSLSFYIDKDGVFYAYIEGVLWFQSDGIKNWLAKAKQTYPGFEDPIAKEYRITFPAKANSTETPSTVFVNSVYINDDDNVLK